MHFSLAVLVPIISLVSAQGGSFIAVGNQYHSGGCDPSALTFADPIFGSGNVCQVLDRAGTNPPIISYKTVQLNAGCKVNLYTGDNCSGTRFDAPLNNCVTGSSPFISVNVTCS
ncbi:hypothetical protein GQ43DRAFT_442728 [Delitschia confertaspora ATCC 74209]|uniref:Uncharacterized protein n=1 Tax=Delitschia confertaspora ATCC 74209 TaxID=1513339 RepID=A0A9P4JH74_9PLEO|nr:hypothetical protein GQ43DRAFT_442728 [Delitschia confertaspora ATCC 74209]